MSSKGQIVVPKNLREQLGISIGTNFAIFGKDDTLVLKMIDVPTKKEAFDKVHKWGMQLARKKNWKEEDFNKRTNSRSR